MENSSCFDFEGAVSAWRKNLKSLSIGAESLLELESHLRDSAASLQTAGHTAEDAFALASYRLGQRHELREEFAKTHGESVWFERILWMLLGAQFFSFLAQLSTLLNGLLAIPRLVNASSGLRHGSAGIWTFMVALGQYAILALLLISALKLLRRRDHDAVRFIEALRRRPRQWCGLLLAVSVSLGLLSLASSLLPTLLHDFLANGAGQSTYRYSNLSMLAVTTLIRALILPGVIFWLVRQAESKRICTGLY